MNFVSKFFIVPIMLMSINNLFGMDDDELRNMLEVAAIDQASQRAEAQNQAVSGSENNLRSQCFLAFFDKDKAATPVVAQVPAGASQDNGVEHVRVNMTAAEWDAQAWAAGDRSLSAPQVPAESEEDVHVFGAGFFTVVQAVRNRLSAIGTWLADHQG